MKIVVNKTPGAYFHLSLEETKAIAEVKGWEVRLQRDSFGNYYEYKEGDDWEFLHQGVFERTDEDVIGVVESSVTTHLKVIEIPDKIEWQIMTEDGMGVEIVVEKGHYW